MRCLITGYSGLIGSHLGRLLLENGASVVGTVHQSRENISDTSATLVQCDISDRASVERVISNCDFDTIFHLAGQSLPMPSWSDPEKTFRTNLLGTLYLFDAIRKFDRSPLILLAGSSAECSFENMGDRRFNETAHIAPSSPYGVSKAAANYLSRLYEKAYEFKVIRVRPLFVVGPGKATNFTSDFAHQIARMEQGLQTTLTVGNTAAVRDLLDVRDAARALMLMAREGRPGELYTLCSGNGYRVSDILNELLGLATLQITPQIDPQKFRPIDAPVLIGDCTRLQRLGWRSEIPISTTLADILSYWRSVVNETENIAAKSRT